MLCELGVLLHDLGLQLVDRAVELLDLLLVRGDLLLRALCGAPSAPVHGPTAGRTELELRDLHLLRVRLQHGALLLQRGLLLADAPLHAIRPASLRL
jgi:hypothetical protein